MATPASRARLSTSANSADSGVSAAAIYAYVEEALGPWDQRPIYKSNATNLSPFRHCKPDLSDEDAAYLELKKPEDALIYNIVTLRPGNATINLKGPIVINRFTMRGKQVVLQNASKWSVRHPLPLATESF